MSLGFVSCQNKYLNMLLTLFSTILLQINDLKKWLKNIFHFISMIVKIKSMLLNCLQLSAMIVYNDCFKVAVWLDLTMLSHTKCPHWSAYAVIPLSSNIFYLRNKGGILWYYLNHLWFIKNVSNFVVLSFAQS
jgi:hypothetical protein